MVLTLDFLTLPCAVLRILCFMYHIVSAKNLNYLPSQAGLSSV